jgi:signal transduction histidine kinase
VPAAIEVAAYRIVREAITNTVRHAYARRCIATIEASDGGLIIDVRDDGVGLAEGTQVGVGLTSMRERTEELGGTFSIAPGAPRGTRVLATLPLANGSARQQSTTAAHAVSKDE